MSAEERIQHIKELNKARAAVYYAKHKEAIAERRKAARQACREALGKAPAVEEVKAPRLRVKRPVADPKEKVDIVAKPAEPVKAPRIKTKKPVKAPSATHINYEQAVIKIERSDKIDSDGSRLTYKNHLKSLQELLKCDNLYDCFMNAPKTIQALENAKQKRDPSKPYSINSKKAFVQAILKLCDVLDIPLSAKTKQEYVDAFDALKLDSSKETEKKIEEGKKEEQLTFDTYLPKVADKFGEDSKEYLTASLYSINGFRDDLQLRLVRVPDEKQDNQLVIAKMGNPYKIVLSKYKTDKKYGVKTITIPSHVSKLVRTYISKHKLKEGNFLLGPNKLTGFISKFNKELGLPISINTYRQMLVSPVIDEMDSKQRVELAKKMNHSPATSTKYKQKKK